MIPDEDGDIEKANTSLLTELVGVDAVKWIYKTIALFGCFFQTHVSVTRGLEINLLPKGWFTIYVTCRIE